MKKLVTLLFLFISFLGFGQSVNAPDPKSFIVSTAEQDASGFTLSGFGSTETLLTSISLVNPPSGTTFYLNTTIGLTPASGFTLSGNKTRLVVTGTMASINTALESLKINTGSVKGDINISVAATVNPTGYYYNGVNGHFYRPITNGTTYTNARAASLLTTFKGQQGYLVTITSADEDQFIIANVPQSNIWFACTDEVTEGRWIIDAGPEKGTLIKTSNGQYAGNVQGQYNNWAGGEPNNSGNEDYPVTKWSGGTQWNDLPNNFNCAYVIEYGTWTNPDDVVFTEFYTNSITHSNGETIKLLFGFKFGSSIDESKFSANILKRDDTTSPWVSAGDSKSLSGLGKVYLSNQIDTAKVFSSSISYKSIISPGGVEWAYVNPNASWLNGNSRLLIDMRQVGSIDPTKIKNVKILDAYDGPVTFISNDGTWAQYSVPSPLTKVTDGTSAYNQYIRNVNGWNTDYAFQCGIGFTQQGEFKQHKLQLKEYDSAQLKTLYNSIVTVSDVWLAFKEVANNGIFGNEIGKEFTYGIQYKNADVDNNGVFNEADCFKLLQNLTGVTDLFSSYTLDNTLHIIPDSTYNTIGKSNWSSFQLFSGREYPFSLVDGKTNYNYDLAVAFKGDVNLSHSAIPPSNGLTTMSVRTTMSTSISNDVNASILTELTNGKLNAYINFNPLQQEVVGNQFQLNYDNSVLKFEGVEFKTKGSPMNYGTNKGTYINLGSLITDGSTLLDNTTEYKVIFTPIKPITNGLGLVGMGTTDAVNKAGKQLNVKIN